MTWTSTSRSGYPHRQWNHYVIPPPVYAKIAKIKRQTVLDIDGIWNKSNSHYFWWEHKFAQLHLIVLANLTCVYSLTQYMHSYWPKHPYKNAESSINHWMQPNQWPLTKWNIHTTEFCTSIKRSMYYYMQPHGWITQR